MATRAGGDLPIPERKIAGKATIFELSVEKGKRVYRYDVVIKREDYMNGQKRVEGKVLTKQTDPTFRSIQRKICRDIVGYYLRTAGFKGLYVYDNKAALFTTVVLSAVSGKLIESRVVGGDVEFYCKGGSLTLEISSTQNNILDYSDFNTSIVTNLQTAGQLDHSVRQFLELATSQAPQQSGAYEAIGSGTLYRNETTPCIPGMEFRSGISKGVRIAEDGGKLKAFVVCDMRKSAFFATSKSLLQIYDEMCQADQRKGHYNFGKIFHGVRMRGNYLQGVNFTFSKLTDQFIGHANYNIVDKKENLGSVPQYYRTKYNLNIDAKAPGAVADGPKTRIYPMDLIFVVPGQVVPSHKVNDFAIRAVLAANSIFPHMRYNHVMNEVRQLCSGPNQQFLNQLGIKINLQSNDVSISQRRGFSLTTGGGQINPERNGTFMSSVTGLKFLSQNRIKKWWVLHRDIFPDKRNAFMASFKETLKNAGSSTPEPAAYVEVGGRKGKSLDQIFLEAKAAQVQFLFYMAPKFSDDHAHFKMLEAYHKILTQQVDTKNVSNNQAQTRKNILLKFNAKAFGINFMPILPPELEEFDLRKQTDLLIIGYDVAHPAPATPKDRFLDKHNNFTDSDGKPTDLQSLSPSVVGICANKSATASLFGGDFFYQESRRENVNSDALNIAVREVLQSTTEKRKINRIVVFRDGVSEGQFEMAINVELRAIKNAIAQVIPTATERPKVTFLIATKQHNKRFYEKLEKIENTKVGDMVVDKVTRQDVPEFYLQSHHPIKGVPRMTQYSVIVDELNINGPKLRGLCHAMSCMHQISACNTSLPLPVYMADELAKRGNDIYHAFARLPNTHEIKNKYRAIARGEFTGRYNNEALTKLFKYHGNQLGLTRFNA